MRDPDLLLRLTGRIVKGCRLPGSVALRLANVRNTCLSGAERVRVHRVGFGFDSMSAASSTIENMFETMAAIDPFADEAWLIERIAELERAKSAAAAGQARAAAALDALRRAHEADAGVPSAQRGRGLGTEIALARRDSPARGGRHLGFAKALVHEMPHTLAALEAGQLSEWRATLIVRESACLDVEDRRALDAEMCADMAALDGVGDARIAAAAKKIAYRLNAQAVVDRSAKAASERTVTIRPAPDTMTWVTALLPVAQGVSVYAALKRAADTTFDGRTRGQVMADTLVERITGRPSDVPEPVAVNLVISDEALLGCDDAAAVVDGYGLIPAAVARGLVSQSVTDARSRATLRRLYKHPTSGALVGMESRARRFPKGLAAFIGLRDQRCRTPYCDAPIRHRDHARPHHRDGPTSAENGLGSCERCNYVKESPGWHVSTKLDETGRHTAEFITPTGMHYHSSAPPQPGPLTVTISEIETRIGIALSRPHAA
ncbi:HNH endonuclease [Mycobacterium celatum]|uniref:HNH endonuclease n=2 Tax=Mycobacterium celatum TaxID=28045 RepID=A0A2G5PCF9_MYCCE|nr:HNH endonuclease [Mycobacterium celatum]